MEVLCRSNSSSARLVEQQWCSHCNKHMSPDWYRRSHLPHWSVDEKRWLTTLNGMPEVPDQDPINGKDLRPAPLEDKQQAQERPPSPVAIPAARVAPSGPRSHAQDAHVIDIRPENDD